MKLKVYSKNLSPFETTIKQVGSRVSIPRRGDFLYAKFDPNEPMNVIVLYERDTEGIEKELEDIEKNIVN